MEGVMANEREFNWGETPAIIVGRLDHFLSVPCWFDGIGSKDVHPTLYDSINFNNEYRTARIKRYHAFAAMFRGVWINETIANVIGHLLISDNSELWLLDGYPATFMNTLYNKFGSAYTQVMDDKPPKSFFNKISIHIVDTDQHFTNELSAAKALADDTTRVLFTLGEKTFPICLPEMDKYHTTLQEYTQLQQKKLLNKYNTASDNITSEPMSQDEIDALLNNDDDNGTLQ